MESAQLQEQLVHQALQIDITLEVQQQNQLMAYLALLQQWNNAFNLTAIREPAQMVTRHLIDSLSILPYIAGSRIIDVGSGPGLPGIPLAICRPDIEVTTLDSNGKKTRFQQQVKAALGLDNLQIINARAEACYEQPFDQVISRAFASLKDMLDWTAHLCHQQGVFLAMKGQYPDDELQNLPAGFLLRASYPLNVPDTEGERHLIVIGRA